MSNNALSEVLARWIEQGAPGIGNFTDRQLMASHARDLGRIENKLAINDAVAVLIAHAQGRVNHDYNGLCPDEVASHGSRDEDCKVCRALMVFDVQKRSGE